MCTRMVYIFTVDTRSLLVALVWNEDKRRQVLKTHGVDKVVAGLIFEGPVVTRVDTRMNYGEVRLISIGLVNDQVFVVVHTQRGEITRLISAWKGGRDDRRDYEDRINGGNPSDA